ncbi:MAG: YigZ family protein, partial [Clostridia bacterium]|nr:YigZ family protein [Clostridia bacterium]
HEGSSTFEDRKSVFIGNALPVKNEKEAIEFVKKIKSEYPDARHNVYAYVTRDNSITRYSDDGEPQGTAGMPVLDVIRKSECTDVAIVVTRYFGGILLGTGGLVHAYTEAAKLALLDAEVITLKMHDIYKISCTYSEYSKIKFKIDTLGYKMTDVNFSDNVDFLVAVPETDSEKLYKELTELSAGKATILLLRKEFDALS